MESETPLAQARGLGSAQEGAGHWWEERLSSVSTLVLLVWLAVSLFRLPDLAYGTIAEWLREPVNTAAMSLFILSFFWHAKLGVKVVVDDYVHEDDNRTILLTLLDFAVYAGAALALVSLLKVGFGGGAA